MFRIDPDRADRALPRHCSDLIHARLKQQTAIAHQRVERAFDLPSSTLTTSTYVSALLKMSLAYDGLRRELDRCLGSDSDAVKEVTTRIEWLRGDLRSFGIGEMSLPILPFVLDDADEALGCEYVMRGSALGGLIIFKLAADRLQVTEHRGGRFFYGYGPSTKVRWSAFLDRLSQSKTAASDSDQLVRGAIKSFEHFERALSTGIAPQRKSMEARETEGNCQ